MPVIHVGAVGQSVWRSDDGGTSFRIRTKGMWAECDIRALTPVPGAADTLYAGSNVGVFRSSDRGDGWDACGTELAGREIWSVAVSALGSGLILAGTCPAGLYVSRDAGASWTQGTGDPIAHDCFGGAMKTRVTSLLMHPTNADIMFAGVEADGPRRSTDGGRTWQRIGLDDVDVHDIKMAPDGTLYLSSNFEVFRSDDEGDSWVPLRIKEHFDNTYCRGVGFSPTDPSVLYVGNGSGPPGHTGAVYRTRDRGESWEKADLNGRTNSCVWQFAASGQWMLASTVLGQVYRSTDGGENWGKLGWEFGEIRGLVCVA